MAVLNIHQRALSASPTKVGTLLDSLASPNDLLWPNEFWPRIRFDREMAPGAIGGHGPIRYTVSHYVPGHWIRFQFTGPPGFDGFHEFAVRPDGERTVLCHTLAMRTRGMARLSWPLVFRPLHDALIEDVLDKAVRSRTGSESAPPGWSSYVRLLRRLASTSRSARR